MFTFYNATIMSHFPPRKDDSLVALALMLVYYLCINTHLIRHFWIKHNNTPESWCTHISHYTLYHTKSALQTYYVDNFFIAEIRRRRRISNILFPAIPFRTIYQPVCKWYVDLFIPNSRSHANQLAAKQYLGQIMTAGCLSTFNV